MRDLSMMSSSEIVAAAESHLAQTIRVGCESLHLEVDRVSEGDPGETIAKTLKVVRASQAALTILLSAANATNPAWCLSAEKQAAAEGRVLKIATEIINPTPAK